MNHTPFLAWLAKSFVKNNRNYETFKYLSLQRRENSSRMNIHFGRQNIQKIYHACMNPRNWEIISHISRINLIIKSTASEQCILAFPQLRYQGQIIGHVNSKGRTSWTIISNIGIFVDIHKIDYISHRPSSSISFKKYSKVHFWGSFL